MSPELLSSRIEIKRSVVKCWTARFEGAVGGAGSSSQRNGASFGERERERASKCMGLGLTEGSGVEV